MAELALVVHDKINTDFYLDCSCYKRGDVIEICPDGWGWSLTELSNPDWRMLRVPESVDEITHLLAPEYDIDPLNPSATLQRRQFKLDIDNDALTSEFKAFIADDARVAPLFIVQQADLITAFSVKKEPIDDPAVFGKSQTIF